MTPIRPHGIQCTKWEPLSLGSKRCGHYIDPVVPQVEGMCRLPDEMLCVEWIRKNGTDAQKRELLGRQPPTPPGRGSLPLAADADPPPLVLAAQDPPTPRPPASLRTTRNGMVLMALPRPFEPAKEIDPTGLEALERAGVEVELSAPHLDGGVILVPARTGRTDRSELTFRECAVIRMIVDAFPGASVTAYRSGSRVFTDSLDRPFDECPLAGTHCSVCGAPQRTTSGGLSCVHGHGGAEPMAKTPADDDRTLEEDPLS